jgi:hypothetical protein
MLAIYGYLGVWINNHYSVLGSLSLIVSPHIKSVGLPAVRRFLAILKLRFHYNVSVSIYTFCMTSLFTFVTTHEEDQAVLSNDVQQIIVRLS